MRKRWKRIVPALLLCMLLSACGNGGGKTGFSVAPPNSNNWEPPMNIEPDTPATSTPEEPSSSASVPEAPSFSASESVSSGAPVQEDSSPSVPDSVSLSPQTPDTPSEPTEGDVLEIGEKMFLTQINDMYFNFDHYKDKTIIVEGMYALFYSWDGSETAPVVYRRGPGCCGNDGWGGFLLKYDGEYPNETDWIRVTGTPELVEEGYYLNLYLNVTSLEVKTERGAEFVIQ